MQIYVVKDQFQGESSECILEKKNVGEAGVSAFVYISVGEWYLLYLKPRSPQVSTNGGR